MHSIISEDVFAPHPPAIVPRARRSAPRRVKMLAFLCAALLITTFVASLCVWDAGDSHEYLEMLQAWSNHGTPDLRPADAHQVAVLLKQPNLRHDFRPFNGFFPDRDGLYFCWHFWVYPLFCLPAKWLLRMVGMWEGQAFFWTNLILVLWASYRAIYGSKLPEAKRWMLVGLAVVSPVLWYVCWMHTEAFCWAGAMLCVVFITEKRYGLAALCAALGSMQNPPLLFLSAYAVVLALLDARKDWPILQHRRRHVVSVLSAVAGATLCLVPTLFSLWRFGHPNLILREQGFPALRFMSWSKVWSAFFDLNQGMLPYVPGLLILSFVAWIYALRKRNWRAVGAGIVVLLMVVSITTSPIWVSATAGMQRYAVWMLPVLAWLIVDALPDTRALRIGVIAAVAVQALIVMSFDAGNDSLQVKAPARLVWNIAPALYNPEPMIFGQRVTGSGFAPSTNYPIGFVASNGSVSKILTDAKGLKHFTQHFAHVDTLWLHEMQQQYGAQSGLFYLHPPVGAVLPRAKLRRVARLRGGAKHGKLESGG